MSAAELFVHRGLAFAIAVACGLPSAALALSPDRPRRLTAWLERRGASGWGSGPAAVQLYAVVGALGSFAWAAWTLSLNVLALALTCPAAMVMVAASFAGHHHRSGGRLAEVVGWGVVLGGLGLEGAILVAVGG